MPSIQTAVAILGRGRSRAGHRARSFALGHGMRARLPATPSLDQEVILFGCRRPGNTEAAEAYHWRDGVRNAELPRLVRKESRASHTHPKFQRSTFPISTAKLCNVLSPSFNPHCIGLLTTAPEPARGPASYGDLPYDQKLPHYNSQNLLARSLHPGSYDHNPGFIKYVQSTGVPFKPHEHFKRADLDQRQALYREIAEEVWNPARLEREANA